MIKVSHRVWSWSDVRLTAELAKCQVLCHEHHLEKTRAYYEATTPHGCSRYDRYACRCDICMEAKRTKNARRYLPH